MADILHFAEFHTLCDEISTPVAGPALGPESGRLPEGTRILGLRPADYSKVNGTVAAMSVADEATWA